MIITFSFELEVSCVSTEDIVASVSSDVSATVSDAATLSPAVIIPWLFPFSTSMLTLSISRFIKHKKYLSIFIDRKPLFEPYFTMNASALTVNKCTTAYIHWHLNKLSLFTISIWTIMCTIVIRIERGSGISYWIEYFKSFELFVFKIRNTSYPEIFEALWPLKKSIRCATCI